MCGSRDWPSEKLAAWQFFFGFCVVLLFIPVRPYSSNPMWVCGGHSPFLYSQHSFISSPTMDFVRTVNYGAPLVLWSRDEYVAHWKFSQRFGIWATGQKYLFSLWTMSYKGCGLPRVLFPTTCWKVVDGRRMRPKHRSRDKQSCDTEPLLTKSHASTWAILRESLFFANKLL